MSESLPAPALVPLPIDEVLPQLVAELRRASSVVLRAPTGAGKTTRVPPAVLAAGLAGTGRVVMVEPRRIAARAAARRIGFEQRWEVGREVGYQVRFDERVTRDTRIVVMTEGILVRRLQSDPFLEGIQVVLLDEFHERSVQMDLVLGMLRRVQQTVRPDLKVVVMSATLDPAPIVAYLGGCPVVASEGRLFPVQLKYSKSLDRRPLEERIAEGIESVLRDTEGDILVFLPGVPEIRRCERFVEPLVRQRSLELMTLFGDLPPEEQDRVLAPCPRRKLVLATNVAETSITIDGVTAVVDSGLAKVMRFDAEVGLDRLELEPISRASAEQRAGRAGRTRPGVCLRLWDEAAHRARPERDDPEVRRVDLAGPVLELHSWGEADVLAFPWFEPPPVEAVARAEHLLSLLGALQAGQVTPLGRALARMPAHPRLARLLLEGCRWSCEREAALAAAMLSERDPFLRDPRARSSQGPPTRHAARSQSDTADRVHALQDFFSQRRRESSFGVINEGAAFFIDRAAKQLLDSLRDRDIAHLIEDNAPPPASAPFNLDAALSRAMLAAWPDRLARRRDAGSPRGVMVGGRGVKLAPQSAVTGAEFFLCVDVDGAGTEALVRQAAAIERDWLSGPSLRTVTELFFHPSQKMVVARQRTYWDDLVLAEATAPLPDSEAVGRVLQEQAIRNWEQVFPAHDEETTNFITRVNCLREWVPELGLPALDESRLQQVLAELCVGRRSLAELKSAPWLAALQGLFNYEQLQTIEREAPERLPIPRGHRIRLQYEPGRPPVWPVKIQDAFGIQETPRIARGRVKVLCHLLAPNQRPQQVTDDLASFWANAYSEVRKELRRRYPKHAWPENPLEVQP